MAEPCADAKTLHCLLALRLSSLEDPLEAGYGFDLVRLAALSTGQRTAEAWLCPAREPPPPDDAARLVARLADRLAARFGRERVSPSPRPTRTSPKMRRGWRRRPVRL